MAELFNALSLKPFEEIFAATMARESTPAGT
jgi:hypothetical protein